MRKLSNNPKHKYWLMDYNGFRVATATTYDHAKHAAKELCREIPIQICWSDRTPFGTRHNIRTVRNPDGYPNMSYGLNGQWMCGRGPNM